MNASETKHTPGPWTVEDDGTVQHESGMVICSMSSSDDFPCLTEDEEKSEAEVRADVDAECAANAHLIAAAPDMLTALKSALTAWAAAKAGDIAAANWMNDAEETMLAAISKAEAAS